MLWKRHDETAASFLASGSWEHTNPMSCGNTSSPCQECGVSIHYRLREYNCPSKSPTRWVRSSSSVASQLRLLDGLSGSRTFWFIGDSVVLSHAQAAACRLASEDALAATGTDSRQPSGVAKWRAPEWPASKYAACIDTAGLRVCYMPAGSRVRGATDSVATVLEKLVALNVTSQNDVAVANSGDWFLGHGPDLEKRIEADAQALARVVLKLCARQCPLRRFVWREALAQHFNTVDGVYDATKHDSRACAALQPNVSKPDALSAASATLSAAGVEVIDGWTLTRARVHAHVSPRDCTHFCLGESGRVGGVYEALNDWLAVLLQAPIRERSSQAAVGAVGAEPSVGRALSEAPHDNDGEPVRLNKGAICGSADHARRYMAFRGNLTKWFEPGPAGTERSQLRQVQLLSNGTTARVSLCQVLWNADAFARIVADPSNTSKPHVRALRNIQAALARLPPSEMGAPPMEWLSLAMLNSDRKTQQHFRMMLSAVPNDFFVYHFNCQDESDRHCLEYANQKWFNESTQIVWRAFKGNTSGCILESVRHAVGWMLGRQPYADQTSLGSRVKVYTHLWIIDADLDFRLFSYPAFRALIAYRRPYLANPSFVATKQGRRATDRLGLRAQLSPPSLSVAGRDRLLLPHLLDDVEFTAPLIDAVLLPAWYEAIAPMDPRTDVHAQRALQMIAVAFAGATGPWPPPPQCGESRGLPRRRPAGVVFDYLPVIHHDTRTLAYTEHTAKKKPSVCVRGSLPQGGNGSCGSWYAAAQPGRRAIASRFGQREPTPLLEDADCNLLVASRNSMRSPLKQTSLVGASSPVFEVRNITLDDAPVRSTYACPDVA